jgi:2-polyprenyl-3-methyl-5-hydroxy-6-metoxy-1,4-benzoquinol methylase
MSSRYVIAGGEAGWRRLTLLARTMAPTTRAHLINAGVREGMTCIDVGCGGGHVTQILAEMSGPSGRVVGIDFDPVKLAAAAAEAESAGFHTIEFRQTDVLQWRESSTYDVVYGRFILSHLPDSRRILDGMRQALKPGGIVVLEDIDFSGGFSHPENDGYRRYCDLYRAVVQRRGGDADLGKRLFELSCAAGFRDVHVQLVQPVHTGNQPEKAMALVTLQNILSSVITESLATESELQAAIDDLEAFTNDPSSLIGLPRIFQVWGRNG